MFINKVNSSQFNKPLEQRLADPNAQVLVKINRL